MSTPTCSFCHKHQSQGLQLVAVPPAYICDECSMLAVDRRERLMSTLARLPDKAGEK